MVLDTVTILTYVIAIAVTAAVTGLSFYAYNKNKESALSKVSSTITTLYNSYAGQIEALNPTLAKECKSAISTLTEAMTNKTTISEAYALLVSLLPLAKRLAEFIEKKISGDTATGTDAKTANTANTAVSTNTSTTGTASTADADAGTATESTDSTE